MKRLALLAGMCTAFLLWSCNAGHNHEDPHDHEAEHGAAEAHGAAGAHAGHSDEIVISPEKAAAAGIMTETASPAEFSGVIRTGGQILSSRGDEMTVVAPADGIVSFGGNYFEGAAVDEGQTLFSVISGTIQDGNRIGKAKVAYEAAKAEYERASSLVDSRIVSQKEYVRIKENYENARLAYEALKPNADGTGVVVSSPCGGYVESIFVREGDYVPMGTPLACVVRNSSLVLQADLSQTYYDRTGEIVSANFRTPSMARTENVKALGGRLLSVGRSTAAASHYIPVTFSIPAGHGLVPGSFAEVWLLTGVRNDVISLPLRAVTEEQGVNFVYIKMDESCYRKQEVTLGESDGERVEIVSGVKAGDNVVTAGAYNVRLASASNAIPAHTHNH